MKKKSQGLPINTLVMAALGLVILVVFFVIFTSEAGDFNKNVAYFFHAILAFHK